MWLTEFRERFGIGLEQLGMQIRRLGAKKSPPLRVSDTLLEQLERDPKFKTVPALADLIAEACAATAAQRDELVLKRYRGTWKPPKRRKPPVVVARPIKVAKPSEAGRPPANGAARGVVKVDRYGVEVGRYRGCGAAARENLIEPRQVTARCHREYRTDEFKAHGYTFRFADEWDAMTEAQRREDVERLNGVSGARGGHNRSRMMTVIDKHNHINHYASMKDAAKAIGATYNVLYHRMDQAERRRQPMATYNGMVFMYTSEWDSLGMEAGAARELAGVADQTPGA